MFEKLMKIFGCKAKEKNIGEGDRQCSAGSSTQANGSIKKQSKLNKEGLCARLVKMGFVEEEIKGALCIPEFCNYASKILMFSKDEDRKRGAIQKYLNDYKSGVLKSEISDVVEQAFSHLPTYLKKLAQELLGLGVDMKILQEMMGKEKFIHYAQKILKCDATVDEKRKVVEKLIKKIQSLSRRRRKAGVRYITLKRLMLLATMVDSGSVSTDQAAQEVKMSYERATKAFKKMQEQGLVSGVRGKEKIWSFTVKGMGYLIGNLTFLQCDIRDLFRIPQYKREPDVNSRLEKFLEKITNGKEMLAFLKKAQKAMCALKKLGWNGPCAKRVGLIHKIDYLLYMIESVQGNAQIKNKGGYLYKVLFHLVSKEKRIEALVEKILPELPQNTREMYAHVAKELEPEQFRWLAYSLRKLHQRCEDVTPGDVQGVLGWIVKREHGLPMREKAWKGRKKRTKSAPADVAKPTTMPADVSPILIPAEVKSIPVPATPMPPIPANGSSEARLNESGDASPYQIPQMNPENAIPQETGKAKGRDSSINCGCGMVLPEPLFSHTREYHGRLHNMKVWKRYATKGIKSYHSNSQPIINSWFIENRKMQHLYMQVRREKASLGDVSHVLSESFQGAGFT